MTTRRVALVAIAFAAGAAHAAPLTPQDFAYARQIDTPEQAAVYRVALPEDVYRTLVRSDLGDLRVFNARGKAVPYVLKHPSGETTSRQPTRPLPLFPLRGDSRAALDAVRVTIESGKAAVDVHTQSMGSGPTAVLSYIADGRSLDVLVDALRLDWPQDAAEFAGRLQVEASDDLGGWHAVTAAAPIANLHADGELLVERRVEFPAAKAKFWRLSWAGAAPSFVLTGVQAEPAADRVDVKRSELVVSGKPAADESGDILFDLGARFPVDRINFELPDRNSIVQIELHSRATPGEPWRSLGQHGFYRLETRNGEMKNGAVAIVTSTDRYWLARIDQRGGGLDEGLPRLRVGWVPDELVFVAKGEGPFQLAYGSGSAKPAEAALGAIPKDLKIVRASLGARHELGGVARLEPAPAPFPWKTVVLWSALALGVALLAWMAYRLAKQL